MSKYQIKLEVSGPTAMWTRPDTGDHPVSYPAPTYSAVKGIMESILWLPTVDVIPNKVEICSPIQYHDYWNNYRGPLRKSTLIKKGNSQQIKMTVLIDVCYRIYVDLNGIDETHAYYSRLKEKEKKALGRTTNTVHAYYDMFYRRLKRGRWYRIPSLGLKEFVPDYVGGFRSETDICKDINLTIPSMTYKTFSSGMRSEEYAPKMLNDVVIKEGGLVYAK